MDIEIIILSEVRKRKTYHMMSLICGILKEDTHELMYKRNRLIDIEDKPEAITRWGGIN